MPNNFVLLDRIELNNTAASVTFDNIPQSGYTDLKIVISARGTGGYEDISLLSINGITTNFSARYLQGDGASASSSTLARWGGNYTAANNTANTFGSAELYFPNYRSSNFKSYSTDNVTETNGTTAYAGIIAGLWSNTAAITSITFTPNSGNYAANSTFSLYGLAQVGTTPAIAPKADGGNVIGTDGTYWYHAFLSNGTFTPQVGLTADVLQVAGGGAGGIAGGGAGGLLEYSSQSLTATNYSITIGSGGTAGTNDVTSGSKGNNSQFGALTASIGGGAGTLNENIGLSFADGGSGGGGGGSSTITTSAGNGTSGQGNAGRGNGGGGTTGFPGGGGGGKGALGTAGSSNQGGNGGIGGTSALINAMAAATSTGQFSSPNYYFAGGGGGGGNGVANFGAGGLGGGGAASNVPVANAVANMGGGGGGYNGGVNKGGNGGSGIIIIRYLVA